MPLDGTKVNDAAAHLIRAKQYIEEHGWCSNSFADNAGRVCIVGAIAMTTKHLCGRAGYIMAEAIGVNPDFIDGYAIGVWNDTRGRTLDEVMAAFDQAIIRAMVEEG